MSVGSLGLPWKRSCERARAWWMGRRARRALAGGQHGWQRSHQAEGAKALGVHRLPLEDLRPRPLVHRVVDRDHRAHVLLLRLVPLAAHRVVEHLRRRVLPRAGLRLARDRGWHAFRRERQALAWRRLLIRRRHVVVWINLSVIDWASASCSWLQHRMARRSASVASVRSRAAGWRGWRRALPVIDRAARRLRRGGRDRAHEESGVKLRGVVAAVVNAHGVWLDDPVT